MPRRSPELKATQVAALKAIGYHPVGGVDGLYLQIASAQARSWILRVSVAGKRREMGLGRFPEVTLADARNQGRQAREAIRGGVDPIAVRASQRSEAAAQRASAMTFEDCARSFIEEQSAGWKNAKHAQQWENTLAQHAHPKLGKLHVRDVQLPHVLAVLQPLWRTKTETASRLRGRIEQILDWATVRKYRTGENPARWRGHLDKVLPAPRRVTSVEHHSALDVDQIGDFMRLLRELSGMGARALEFTILTAARSGEVRGALWSEIDLDRAVWTVPAARMKKGKEHRVPLSPPALALLKDLPRVVGDDLVFLGTKRQGDGSATPLSDMTLTAVLRRAGVNATTHGMRSTFRDWAGERTSHAREVIEHALAHQLKDKAEASYARGDLFDRRRSLMSDWANFLSSVRGSLVKASTPGVDVPPGKCPPVAAKVTRRKNAAPNGHQSATAMPPRRKPSGRTT